MKRNLLVSASGVSLLYLLVGLLPVKALAVKEGNNSKTISTTETLPQEILSFDGAISSEKVNNQIPFEQIFATNEITTKAAVNEKQENAIASLNQSNQQLNKKPILTAQTPQFNQNQKQNSQQNTNSPGQVTSVSQLSDVQPTDWAFQALQSLVER